MAPCPDCQHDKTQHTDRAGCLAQPEPEGWCSCERGAFVEDKTLGQAHAERDQAMAQAQQGTDPTWEEEATSAIRTLQERESFTPDDVWVLLEERQVPPPREPRALGPILKRLAKAGDIRPVGFTESRRRHGAPVRIYEARTA